MKRILMAGLVFNRLTVLADVPEHHKQQTMVLCRCVCGTEKLLAAHRVRSGGTKSCGCLPLERGRPDHSQLKHGLTYTPEYKVWRGMLERCDERSLDRHLYFDRGITVCPEWQSVAQFVADMGPRPSPKHSIDRINNDLGYSKENCRWATWVEQARNKRTNKIVTFRGESRSLAEWASISGVSRGCIGMRLRSGWPVDRAITEAPRPRHVRMR